MPSQSHRVVTAAPLPRTTLLLQAARRVSALHATEVPRVLALAQVLRVQAEAWCVVGLLYVLRAHAAAAGALRFDLLVSKSLRGAPNRDSEAAFRLQVEEVSVCTEVTWAQVRGSLALRNQADTVPARVADFSMGMRALERAAADAADGLARAREDAAGHQLELGQAAVYLQVKLDEAQAHVHQVLWVSTNAVRVRGAAYHAADAQGVLRSALRDLAMVLRGGLLMRLAAVVASDVMMPAEELRLAADEREVLRHALEKAVRSAEEARLAQESLLETLGQILPEI